MSFKLPDLPYPKEAFGKIISSETFDYHYSKHHKTYVDNLTISSREPNGKTNPSMTSFVRNYYLILSCKDTKIFNNVAQHWNHTFYWYCMTPDKTEPSG